MFILDIGGDGAYANAHRSDKNEGIEFIPMLPNLGTIYGFGTKFTLEDVSNILASLADLYDGYLLHFNISMG